MRSLLRSGLAAVLLAGVLIFAGCAPTEADVEGLQESASALENVNDAFVEVQHPGLPTNTQVVVWLFTDAPGVVDIAGIVRDLADVIDADASVRRHEVRVAVVPGTPQQHPTRADMNANTISAMHEVAEELGLPESAGRYLTLRPEDVRTLTGTEN